jgi:hypothetical protein
VLNPEELRILVQSLLMMNPQIGYHPSPYCSNITFLHLSVHQYGSYVMKTLLVLSDKLAIKAVQTFFQQNPHYIMFLNMNQFGTNSTPTPRATYSLDP